MRIYGDTTTLQSFLGQSLTPGQQIEATRLLIAVSAEIEGETNRAWLMGAVSEPFYHPSEKIWLRYAPVDSITELRGRPGPALAEVVLSENDDYVIKSVAEGYIKLIHPKRWERVVVDYVQVDGVPADIEQAAVEMVAARLMPALNPGTYGVDSIQLPDYTVRYARSHVQQALPPVARQILERWRWPVIA
jgi:hypothetical protein